MSDIINQTKKRFMSNESDIVMKLKKESVIPFFKENLASIEKSIDPYAKGQGAYLGEVIYFKKSAGYRRGQVIQLELDATVYHEAIDPVKEAMVKKGWGINIIMYYQAFDYDDYLTGFLLVHKEISFA